MLVSLAALAFLTPLAPAAVPDAPARPSLDVLSVDPLRVRGERFRPYELVSVSASVGTRTHVVRTRAGRRGGFTVVFRTSACSATVRAVGRRGSRATVTVDHITCPPLG